MKEIRCELKSYRRLSDKSVSLKLDSLVEVSSQDIKELDESLGNIGLVLVSDTANPENLDFDVSKIIKENAGDLDISRSKSHSERLRNVLYLVCQKQLGYKPTEEEFAEAYADMMEKVIQHFKDKLD